ncbi:MAG TPA: glycosyltransferase [Chryseolinea sp.]|nr:glycosyltransferase [Chryseolinea sp.]
MKNVLVTPLDWGLGHATRCVPIINELLKRDCNVFIGGCGDSLELLKKEFPALPFFSLPAYRPVYPSSGSMVLKMFTQIPKFLTTVKQEHVAIEKIVKESKIDLVISDNRYGCWTSVIPSVFITHQTNLLLPKRFKWLTKTVRRLNLSLIRKFSTCWIPDYPDGRSLAGKLKSLGKRNLKIKIKYIGALSRFGQPTSREILYDIVCVLSGPEPQRSALEQIAIDGLSRSGLRYFVVRGVVGQSNDAGSNHNQVNFLKGSDLQAIIEQSECVLARSGYSTIMDLAKLGKKAIFVPTPGQTEQEYLAARLRAKGIAFSVAQENFDIMDAWTRSRSFTGFNEFPGDVRLLTDALDEIFTPKIPEQL